MECLNNLLQRNYDAEKGFKKAAEEVENYSLQRFFKTKAEQRRTFQNELSSEIIRLGGDPEADGSMQGSLHRFWMDVVGTFTGKDEEEILDSCEDGEEKALESYNEALEKDFLTHQIRTLMSRQRSTIANTKRRIDVMEEQFDS